MKELKRWDEIINRVDKNKPVFRIAEVGVWIGKTALRVLKSCPNVFLYMIDRWCVPPAGDSYLTSGSSMALSEKKIFDDAYNKCMAIHNKYPDRSEIIKMDSVESAGLYKDGFFDLVFIDGDHSYKGCKRDVKAWLPKVKNGGFMSGHDYAHPDQGDVKEVVDELFNGQEIILGGNRTWFVRV